MLCRREAISLVFFYLWINRAPNSACVNLLFKILHSAGILQLYYETATRQKTQLVVDSNLKNVETAVATINKNSRQAGSLETSDVSLKISSVKMMLAYFGLGTTVDSVAFVGFSLYRVLFHSVYYYFAMFLSMLRRICKEISTSHTLLGID